ncbi:MAG: 50S ribosomal protein L11 methyltransferase [Oscillospiraceae bacterium]|nr:50S ribosomal protein L11 methyltransferase [Oscillospiraceae bacterium]
MQWTELTIRSASGGIELLCAELTEAGFDSFMIDDTSEFQNFLEEAQDYWDYVDESLSEKMSDISQVRLYLEEDAAQGEILRLQTLLRELPTRYPGADFGPLTIALDNVPEEDWENSWKQSYRPLPIGGKLLVVPKWMTVDDTQGRLPIYLDLGLTFGTGEHASTRMCMSALEQLVKGGERVADLGSGSGILSICALRLGAQSAVGIDVDPAAEHIATENALSNGFGAEQFSACTGNVITDRRRMEELAQGGYDIVCANIVAGVLVQLMPVIPCFLRENAHFLCSGILAEREEEVRQAAQQAGLTITRAFHEEGWCCLVGRK